MTNCSQFPDEPVRNDELNNSASHEPLSRAQVEQHISGVLNAVHASFGQDTYDYIEKAFGDWDITDAALRAHLAQVQEEAAQTALSLIDAMKEVVELHAQLAQVTAESEARSNAFQVEREVICDLQQQLAEAQAQITPLEAR